MAIAFKHHYKSDSLIGTGKIKFLRYSITSPLSISYALTNCTADSTNPTEIVKGKTYDFGFTANSGYEFPSSGTTSVSGGTIVVWDYPDASDLTKITVAIEVTGNLTITQIASVALPQLATPANVSADGTTVSWDEVENATSYEVRADGVSIGMVENETEDALAGTWVFNDTLDFSSIIPENEEMAKWDLVFESGTNSLGVSIVYNTITIRYALEYDVYGLVYSQNNNSGTGVGEPVVGDIYFSVDVPDEGIVAGWQDEAKKTITITSKLSEVTNGETLLTWLQANATKQ